MKKQGTRGSKTQFPEMKDWESSADRLEALKVFVTDLNAMTAAQVEAFVNSPSKTKTKFAKCGPFYEEGKTNPAYAPWNPQSGPKRIPKTTEFCVFRNGNVTDFIKRDKHVILIVNPAGNADEPLGAAQTWRCTYSPYLGQQNGHPLQSKPRGRK